MTISYVCKLLLNDSRVKNINLHMELHMKLSLSKLLLKLFKHLICNYFSWLNPLALSQFVQRHYFRAVILPNMTCLTVCSKPFNNSNV